MPIFPLRKRAKLTYNELFTVTPLTGASLSGYVFSANGLYDPNITSTGHQPSGFDQMMAFYEHYTVTHCKATFCFANSKIDQGCLCALAVQAGPSVLSTSAWNQLLEAGNVKYEFLNAGGENGGTNANSRIEYSVNIADFGGVDDLMDREDYRGDVANNPAEQTYFVFYFRTALTQTATDVIIVNAFFEYDAVFTEPRQVAESLSEAKHHVEDARASSLSSNQSSLNSATPQKGVITLPTSSVGAPKSSSTNATLNVTRLESKPFVWPTSG